MEVKSSNYVAAETDKMIEIIKGQLYFAVIKGLAGKKIKSTADALYFSIDEEFEYQNYYYDFGPYNISYLFKYCCKLNKYLEFSKGQKRVVHCTCTTPEKKVNSAYLIGAFSVLYLKVYPDDIYKLLLQAGPFKHFMDASQIPFPYTISLDHCFHALAKAQSFNFVNFDDFDVTEYDMYEKLQFGDMNWLVPRKFLAFIGPNTKEFFSGHPPDYYLKYFLKNDIKTVIRLNNRMYDSAVFTEAGIKHYDLIYPDGSTPPKDILLKFLQIAETSPAAIAVHCKAGLGRTGSLIGAYIIKHYRMTAREAISWMRICRPGSVIGQQQIWLEKMEQWLWKIGTHFRCKHFGDGDKIPQHAYGIYSRQWPVERHKIIREAKRKYLNQPSPVDPQNLNRQRKVIKTDKSGTSKTQYHRFKKRPLGEKSSFEDISKILTSVYGLEPAEVNKPMSSIRVLTTESVPLPRQVATTRMSPGVYSGRSENLRPYRKRDTKDYSSDTYTKLIDANRCAREGIEGDNEYTKFIKEQVSRIRKSGQFSLSPRKNSTTMSNTNRVSSTSKHVQSEEKPKKDALLQTISQTMNQTTQGDKLNEIKAIKNTLDCRTHDAKKNPKTEMRSRHYYYN